MPQKLQSNIVVYIVYQEPESRILAINQPDLHLNYNLFQLRLTNDATRFTGCNANDENWFKFGEIYGAI